MTQEPESLNHLGKFPRRASSLFVQRLLEIPADLEMTPRCPQLTTPKPGRQCHLPAGLVSWQLLSSRTHKEDRTPADLGSAKGAKLFSFTKDGGAQCAAATTEQI